MFHLNQLKLHIFFLSGLLLSFICKLEAPEERSSHTQMKTTIIIPCHYLHFYLIPELLSHYENQTIIPDEIVVSLSEAHKVQDKLIVKVENTKYPFQLKIIKSQEVLYGGQNRNKACEHSTGDILISQDADDIPHPQRVELIKSLFERYQIDHLMHHFILSDKKFTFYYPENLSNLIQYCSDAYSVCNNPLYHNGNIAIARYVFDKVKWPSHERLGEDVEFNTAVYNQFKKTVILPWPLLLYRNNLSVY